MGLLAFWVHGLQFWVTNLRISHKIGQKKPYGGGFEATHRGHGNGEAVLLALINGFDRRIKFVARILAMEALIHREYFAVVNVLEKLFLVHFGEGFVSPEVFPEKRNNVSVSGQLYDNHFYELIQEMLPKRVVTSTSKAQKNKFVYFSHTGPKRKTTHTKVKYSSQSAASRGC